MRRCTSDLSLVSPQSCLEFFFRLILFGLVFLTQPALVAQNHTFNTPVILGSNPSEFPSTLEVADFNRDGHSDILSTSKEGISVRLGDGRGSFGQPIITRSLRFQWITLADFDNDGIVDLAGSERQTDRIFVYVGDGRGAFAEFTDFDIASLSDDGGPTFITSGNLNSDQFFDIAASVDSNQIVVIHGGENGQFEEPQFITIGQPITDLEIADINGDGIGDLVFVFFFEGTYVLAILPGQPDGRFGAQIIFGVTDSEMAIGDLNGDEYADIVIGSSIFVGLQDFTFNIKNFDPIGRVEIADVDGDAINDLVGIGNRDLTIRFGLGDATFNGDLQLVAGIRQNKIGVADFNSDGVRDIVTSGNDIVINQFNLTLSPFENHRNFEVPGGPIVVASADFNSDSIMDLAITNSLGDEQFVRIFLGNGDGDFELKNEIPVLSSFSIEIADFNQDGIPDIATPEYNLYLGVGHKSIVTILVGNGDGTFSLGRAVDIRGLQPSGLAVADFNNDGLMDFVTANSQSFNISVVLGQGELNFAEPIQYDLEFPFGPISIAVSDFDQDGNEDIALTRRFRLTVFLGNGDGTFVESETYFFMVQNPWAVQTADLNGDQITDVLAAGTSSTSFPEYSENLAVFIGKGDGCFAEPEFYPFGLGAFSIALADFNGDQVIDVVGGNVVNDQSEQGLTMLLGNADGTFQSLQRFRSGPTPAHVVSNDFDGDGGCDLAVVDVFSDRLTIYLNQNYPLVGDVNRDGVIDLLDVSKFVCLLANGLFQPEADIDGDGSLTPSDIEPFVDLLIGN